ncbi:hypothetical protein P3T27_002501 [Kitasatospora sp. MAA19]|nr:hypothetical protein [Kitasatospora sp. MAA19]
MATDDLLARLLWWACFAAALLAGISWQSRNRK